MAAIAGPSGSGGARASRAAKRSGKRKDDDDEDVPHRQIRALSPKVDWDCSYVADHEGVQTRVYYPLNQENKERRKRVGHDPAYPPCQESIESDPKKGAVENTWLPAKLIHPAGRLINTRCSLKKLEVALKCYLKNHKQGNFEDCWYVQATYLFLYFRADLVPWVVVRGDPFDIYERYVLRTRVHQVWIEVFLDPMFAVKELSEGAALPEVDNEESAKPGLELLGVPNDPTGCFLGSGLEKLGARNHKNFKLMGGGFSAEGVSFYAETYVSELKLGKGTEEYLKRKMYSAMKSMELQKKKGLGGMVALASTPAKKRGKHDVKLVSHHAFGVIKLYEATFDGFPLLLALLRDPHGVRIRGPFCPGTTFFDRLDDDTKAKITKDLEEEGMVVIPVSLICEKFERAEIIKFLPPTPASTTTKKPESHEGKWLDLKFRLATEYGSYKSGKEHTMSSPKVRSKNVVNFTQPGRRLQKGKSSYQQVEVTVTKRETGEEIGSAGPLNRYQLAVEFWTEDETQFDITVTNHSDQNKDYPYQLDIYSLEKFPRDPKMPAKFAQSDEHILALLDDSPYGLQSGEPEPEPAEDASCQDYHSYLGRNLFKREKKKQPEGLQKADSH